MKDRYETYEAIQMNDKINIARELIEAAEAREIPVEKSPETLKELIDMDLGENVPPQLYELISCVVDMIEQVEKS